MAWNATRGFYVGTIPPDTATISTYPPPLGERNRKSRWTTSHIDSHTMGDHEDEIPELSSPPQEVGEEDPTPLGTHVNPSLYYVSILLLDAYAL